MAEVDAFGKVLYETISANKLSASRVDRVKSYAVRCFHESSLLVKMIIKCHKKASKSTKVSSLYLFDAVARHASDAVRKHGKGLDASGARAPKKDSSVQPGTAEALVAGAKVFLSTAQLAAQELCTDTMAVVSLEQKEKVKKVVDIWGKANTFDASFLSKLQATLAESMTASSSPPVHTSAVSTERSTTPVGEPRPAEDGPSSKPVEASTDANSILQTLSGVLQGLRSNTAGPSPVSTQPTQPQFDLSQLSALQQLAAASTISSAPSTFATTSGASQGHLPSSRPPPSITTTTNPNNHPSQSPAVSWDPPRPQNSIRSPIPSHPPEAKRSRFSVDQGTNGLASGLGKDDSLLSPTGAGKTLADFDMSTFDPTQPISWQNLAGMWKNTYGYVPSNQELMMCMMMGSFPPVPSLSAAASDGFKHISNDNQWNNHDQQQHFGRNGS